MSFVAGSSSTWHFRVQRTNGHGVRGKQIYGSDLTFWHCGTALISMATLNGQNWNDKTTEKQLLKHDRSSPSPSPLENRTDEIVPGCEVAAAALPSRTASQTQLSRAPCQSVSQSNTRLSWTCLDAMADNVDGSHKLFFTIAERARVYNLSHTHFASDVAVFTVYILCKRWQMDLWYHLSIGVSVVRW